MVVEKHQTLFHAKFGLKILSTHHAPTDVKLSSGPAILSKLQAAADAQFGPGSLSKHETPIDVQSKHQAHIDFVFGRGILRKHQTPTDVKFSPGILTLHKHPSTLIRAQVSRTHAKQKLMLSSAPRY